MKHAKKQAQRILKQIRAIVFPAYQPEKHYMRGPGPKSGV